MQRSFPLKFVPIPLLCSERVKMLSPQINSHSMWIAQQFTDENDSFSSFYLYEYENDFALSTPHLSISIIQCDKPIELSL